MTTRFKKIGLWGHLGETGVAEPALEIFTQLRVLGLDVLIPDQENIPTGFRNATCVPADQLGAEVDLIIAVGGDGTMLHAARRSATYSVPLLGVNRGRLGFLTDISPELMAETIGAVISGDYIAETRLMLQAKITSTNKTLGPMLALNDVALKTVHTGHMQDFRTYVDGEYVNTHGGDGLIIATPTGSTAYALSCGGPIIQPDVDALVIVPIAPHTLSDRPLVVRSSSQIVVRIEPRLDHQSATVACDGEDLGEMSKEETLTISMSEKTVQLLHPQGHSYYELLRSKLSWGQNNRAQRPDSNPDD
jgi:NAD+ kinase|tara:strand:+ start:362 stop:1276 length:915 start_codon:yes stop_codon:yes gene_type:complete